jgi:hypothetical protein
MHDLSLLSEAQKRRIKPYLPLSHDIPRVDDRGYSAGSLSSSGMDCVGAMYLATTPPHMTMRPYLHVSNLHRRRRLLAVIDEP